LIIILERTFWLASQLYICFANYYHIPFCINSRRDSRYKRCHQNPLIEETQTKQWQKQDKRINNDTQYMHKIIKNRKKDLKTNETQIKICYSRIDNHSREHILTRFTTICMFCNEENEYICFQNISSVILLVNLNGRPSWVEQIMFKI
jgi:hypothetical protein